MGTQPRTEARATLDAATSEKDFQQAVIDYARLNNWIVYHTFRSDHSPAGFPDLVLCRQEIGGHGKARSRLLFLECKSERGRLTDRQDIWLRWLGFVPGVVARVVRPSDWDWLVGTLGGSE